MRGQELEKQKRVLIYNRGEIALRAAKTAQSLGFFVIWGVYENDDNCKTDFFVDQKVYIDEKKYGLDFYTNLKSLRKFIEHFPSDYLYPGYGFLSESEELSLFCQENGVRFIGPKAEVLIQTGNKSEAVHLAQNFGIATLEVRPSDKKTFPLMLKKNDGGGGRGNYIVESETCLDSLLKRLELKESDYLLERYLDKALHIELQFMSWNSANGRETVILGLRDCSAQRNFQKIIEESLFHQDVDDLFSQIKPKLKAMIDSIEYEGVGTIEFLYDTRNEEAFFMEINPRIQVEHTVTEEECAVDLVRAQFQITAGMTVDSQVSSKSVHALQLRVYAEDPLENFVPDYSPLNKIIFPEGPFLRVESHLSDRESNREGFDPLIAKIIVRASSREKALDRARGALLNMHVFGVKTNIPLLVALLQSETFLRRRIYSRWIEKEFFLDWKKAYSSQREKLESKLCDSLEKEWKEKTEESFLPQRGETVEGEAWKQWHKRRR